MGIKNLAEQIKRFSLLLFIIPLITLLLTVFASNLLINFNFVESQTFSRNFPVTIDCNKKNDFCGKNTKYYKKTNKLENCQRTLVNTHIEINDEVINIDEYQDNFFIPIDSTANNPVLKTEHRNKKIKRVINNTDIIESNCIINSSFYKYYKIFPGVFDFIGKVKSNKKYNIGISKTINPFFYGETSISNLVKRFPINYIFKPLMFITSILMILYWFSYNKVFNKVQKNKKFNFFFIFGSLSSIFLFFHVLFLGTNIDNEVFTKVRKLILVLFILFEVTAQGLLTRKIFILKEFLNSFINNKVLNNKILFIYLILIATLFIVTVLLFFNLESSFDYLFEWNYFSILLLYYFLSFLMWKKI